MGIKRNFCGSKKSFLVNDTAVRAAKLMQDFHAKITAKEEQKQYPFLCVQEHRRKLYPECKKETLKGKYSHYFFVFL